jgi:hypothetical protein
MLPTRFELVLLDSKSNVLTTTLWKPKKTYFIASRTLTPFVTPCIVFISKY